MFAFIFERTITIKRENEKCFFGRTRLTRCPRYRRIFEPIELSGKNKNTTYLVDDINSNPSRGTEKMRFYIFQTVRFNS